MTLKDRFNKASNKKYGFGMSPEMLASPVYSVEDIYKVKEEICNSLLEKLHNFEPWHTYNIEEQNLYIKKYVSNALMDNYSSLDLSKSEKDRLIAEISQDIKGFGPISSLYADASISEIFLNDYKNIFVKKAGKIYKTSFSFKSERHLQETIKRIVKDAGGEINLENPIAEVKLSDGSRLNATFPPLSIKGATLTIQKVNPNLGTIEKLLKMMFLPKETANILEIAVRNKLNILICGDKDSGKTELLNSLVALIPYTERVLVVEDFAELNLKQDNLLRFETKPQSINGNDEITLPMVTKTALRMKPDRLILGECLSSEVFDIHQALSSGLKGFMTTIYSSSQEEALNNMLRMCLMAQSSLSENIIKAQIASNIDLIIEVKKYQDGSKRIAGIYETAKIKNGEFVLNKLFSFKEDYSLKNKMHGEHIANGIEPKFFGKLQEKDIFQIQQYFSKDYKYSYLYDTKETKETMPGKSAEINKKEDGQIKNRLKRLKKS